ncbi:MAG: hypothetical protein BYD32DRAFT_165331 [Podila humilis]|nr:MAG: hypothetical protein BYD32DRAFT_165331 [Podila humilis]
MADMYAPSPIQLHHSGIRILRMTRQCRRETTTTATTRSPCLTPCLFCLHELFFLVPQKSQRSQMSQRWSRCQVLPPESARPKNPSRKGVKSDLLRQVRPPSLLTSKTTVIRRMTISMRISTFWKLPTSFTRAAVLVASRSTSRLFLRMTSWKTRTRKRMRWLLRSWSRRRRMTKKTRRRRRRKRTNKQVVSHFFHLFCIGER